LSGRELFISERTVAQHLTTIFNKLSVNTRAQAVAVATQRGLLQTTLAVPRYITHLSSPPPCCHECANGGCGCHAARLCW
jgi:hypothetical protein